jgi:hypothetical protein
MNDPQPRAIIPNIQYSTDAMLLSLKEKPENELSPKSKMSKKILIDIKESEKQINKDLKKIKDI